MRLATMALLVVVVMGLSSCSSSPEERPGKVVAATATSIATVEAIDSANRTVTLKLSDGTQNTYKLGPDVRNFNQIEVGDHVKTTVIQSLAVFVRKAGDPASPGEASVVVLAPKGDKPGMVMAKTSEVTAAIVFLDVENRIVTLKGPEGNTLTFTVAPDVNLKAVKQGDDVTIRYTEAVAIRVQKP